MDMAVVPDHRVFASGRSEPDAENRTVGAREIGHHHRYRSHSREWRIYYGGYIWRTLSRPLHRMVVRRGPSPEIYQTSGL